MNMAKNKNTFSNEETVLTAKAKTVLEPQLLITFDRYFTSTGRPARHKAGMLAYASTKGKKSVEAWNKIYEKY